ncbi:hypothetical protein [Micavibrio aeruginosavorus]|uniref:hypothetical protein n=1 Tax=Micavibrio aeruginosavorus TaxID=349221 RepID=UPI003F4A9982
MESQQNTTDRNRRDPLKELDFLALSVRNGRKSQHVHDVNLIMAQRPRTRSQNHKTI